MKDTLNVKSLCSATRLRLTPKQTFSVLTALTMCLQSGLYLEGQAKSSSSKKLQKQSIKKARYEKSRSRKIAKLPFSSSDDKSSKTDKEDSDKAKESDDSVVIDDIDVIEIDQDEPDKKTSKADEADTEVSKESEAKDSNPKEVSEEPKLLPDNALISVLNDISKALKSLDEDMVSDQDEKKVIEMARKILTESLSGNGIEADRILKPEHEKNARRTMIVEAWSSGDVKVSNDLHGSVAAVWGKRIDGILNVTIAGESNNEKSSQGKEIGKFIVIVSGKSPIKKGFDIQSQADVTFWIGQVGGIDVDAACLKKKSSEKDSSSDEKAIEDEVSSSSDTEVKKKSLVTLSPILTDRKREYLALYATYKATLAENAKKLEEKEKEAKELAEKQAKENEQAKASQIALNNSKTQYRFYPDEVEIIEIEEEDVPDSSDEQITVDSDYDHIQSTEENTKSSSKKKVKRTRRIRRVPRRYFEFGPKEYSEMISARKAQKSMLVKDREEEQETEQEDDQKTNQEIETSENKLQDSEKEEALSNTKKEEEDTTAKNNSSKDSKATDTESDETSKVVANALENEDVAKPQNEPVIEPKVKEESINTKDAQKNETKKVAQNKISESKEEPKSKESISSPDQDKKSELDKKLASITTIAPIKPNRNNESNQAQSSTTVNQKWESPAQSIIMRQPSMGATLVYPARALAGNFLTVCVIDKYGNPEPSVELSFNGATLSTDKKGQAMFMVPEDATPGKTLHVSLAARPELSPGVIEVLQPLFTTQETAAPTIDKCSKLVADSNALIIDGHDFLGMANKNRVLIDSEHLATVIAASPVQLQLKMPKSLPCGKHKANVANTALRSNPVVFEYIKAKVVEGKKAKTKKNGDVIIKINGTEAPVSVRVTNKTPDIVKINKGNNLLITTSGGTENTSKVDIKRLKKGSFRIDARIE